MHWEIFKVVSPYVIGLFTIIVSMVSYMGKNLHERIKKIEERQNETATHEDVRHLVKDKIEPLDKRIDKIDTKLDRIIEMLIDK